MVENRIRIIDMIRQEDKRSKDRYRRKKKPHTFCVFLQSVREVRWGTAKNRRKSIGIIDAFVGKGKGLKK